MTRELGDRHGEATTRQQLARADLAQGDRATARAAYESVVELFRELGDRRREAEVLEALAALADA